MTSVEAREGAGGEGRVMDEMLKPCPFCGGEAKLETYGGTACAVVCQSCHCGTPTVSLNDGERAVEAWNRRAERTCRMEAFLLGEFFTGHRLTTSTDMSDDEMDALLEKLREDTIIRCSACHFSVPDGANVSYEQSDDGTWSVSGCEPRANYCAHCGARVVEEEA